MDDVLLPSDFTRRAYHSGLSGTVLSEQDVRQARTRAVADRRIRFLTSTYVPPKYTVTLRCQIPDWDHDHRGTYRNGLWEFTVPGTDLSRDLFCKLMLDGKFWMVGRDVRIDPYESSRTLIEAYVQFGFEVNFATNLWRPNHLVTLRNSVDGWTRDIFGSFRDGQWRFVLDRDLYPDSFEAKLVLDQSLFMEGSNLTISTASPVSNHSDTDITFASSPTAYRHGYDNLSCVEFPMEQSTFRLTSGRAQDHYDVIIIGSGMAGGALADSLTDRGYRVLVLEAGGYKYPVHINEIPRSETDFAARDQLGHFVNHGTPFFAPGVHFNFGGRSLYWSGLILQMNDWEFRDIWPESVKNYLLTGGGYTDAEKLLKKQKKCCGFQDNIRTHLNTNLADFDVFDLPRALHQPDIDDTGAFQNALRRSNGAFSTADLLLDSLGFGGAPGRDSLRINFHHLATRIEKNGTAVTGVTCQDLAGRMERTYEADYVVMCCGSIESPKLALNSGLDDPNTLMGFGLTDHPAYFYKVFHDLPQTGPLAWIGDPKGHAKLLLRHTSAGVAHPYNIELLINPRYWDSRHADDELWNSRVENGGVSKVEIKFLFDSLLNDSNKIVPIPGGEKPEVHVAVNDWAKDFKEEMVNVRNQILTELGVTGLSTDWVDWQWSEGIHGTVHHAGGTLRMSDDGSGVVDDTLKFLSYDNLYCCDASVFPTIPAANPSLTLVALALRLADTLATRLGPPS